MRIPLIQRDPRTHIKSSEQTLTLSDEQTDETFATGSVIFFYMSHEHCSGFYSERTSSCNLFYY
jgi:hypothetical protein